MPELAEQVQQMLTEFKGELKKEFEITVEDGKVIKLTDLLKAHPEMAAKHADLERRLIEIETKVRERKYAGDVPGVDAEKFSFFRALNAIVTRDWSGAGYEKEVFDQTRKRAMSTADDAAGGYLIPVQAMGDFIEMLRAQPIVFQLGARLLDNLQGSPVLFPKQTGGCTVYWVGDNTAPTPSQPAVGQLQMTPKKAMALVQLSNSLIRMAQPSAEALVRQDVAAALGLAIDYAVLRGPGTQYQPRGIANTPDINTVVMGDNGAVLPNFDFAADMEYELAKDNAWQGKLGFAFNPVIKRNLKKLKVAQFSTDTGGEYMMPFPMTDAQLEAYLGAPFRMSTQIPINLTKGTATNCTEIFYGNWLEVLVGQWAGLRIMASDQAGTSFAADQTWVRIIAEIDVALRHEESMCLINDAKIA